jgi:L-fuculose-phosphate aldolase
VAPFVKSHDGLLLANHGALALGKDLFGAYYKMETIEHFARISLTARLLGREHLLSRDEVMRLQDLRSAYGIAAPAPFCPDPDPASPDPSCQLIQAPDSPRDRLVPDTNVGAPSAGLSIGPDGEIRLTYAELTALIDEAVKAIAGR